MKKLALTLVLIVTLLGGCAAGTLKIPDGEIAEIWMDTLPRQAQGPRYTTDAALIQQLIQALKGQGLQSISPDQTEPLAGQSTLLEIRFADGTTIRYVSDGATLSDTEGNHYKIDKPADWAPLMEQMDSPSIITGIIESVTDTEDFYSLMILVDPDAQAAVSDKTSLRVPKAMISGKTPEAQDRITAYLDGPVAESYPTQSRAWSAVIEPSTAAALVHFEYGYGSYFTGYLSYVLNVQPDGQAQFIAFGSNGIELDIDRPVDDAVIDALSTLLEQHGIAQWDGFNEADRDIADGSSFTLSAAYDNHTGLAANGYMAFPENFEEANEAILAFFEELVQEE